jgi:hypothetical protein
MAPHLLGLKEQGEGKIRIIHKDVITRVSSF